MEKHLSSICDKLVELMLDSSGDVRMALYTLLDEVLPILPETLVSPFFPLFVAYISTGMTHVNGAVRLDALQYSNLWLHYHPQLVARFHSKLLPHYLTLMTMRDPPPSAAQGPERIRRLQKKEKTTMHAAKLHIPNALKMKNVLLASLYELVVAQLGHAEFYGTHENLDLQSCAQARRHLYLGAASDDLANSAFPRSAPLVVPLMSSYSTEEIFLANPFLASHGAVTIESTKAQNEDFSPTEAKLHLDEPECFKYFFTIVFPLLVSQWIECGPESLTPHALKPLESILKLFDFLLSHLDSLIGSDSESRLAKLAFLEPYLAPIESHVFTHFPFDYPPNFTEDELSIVTHLNVLISMLGSHFYSEETSEKGWAKSILQYTLRAFTGNISRPVGRRGKQSESTSHSSAMEVSESRPKAGKGMSKAEALAAAVHYQIVGELLPVIRRLTSYSDDEDRIQLLKAFQAFNESCPPASPSKRMSIAFLASLLLDFEPQDTQESENSKKSSMDIAHSEDASQNDSSDLLLLPRPPSTTLPSDITLSLLISLPKTLWQLQGDHPITSQLILGVLTKFGANVSNFSYVSKDSASPTCSQRSAFDKLQSALVPFFWTSIAKKPKANKKPKGEKDAKSEKTKSTAETSEDPSSKANADEPEEESRREVFGPFVKLPLHVQRCAIDLISQFSPLSPAMVDSLLHTFTSPKVSNEAIGYLFETIKPVGGHFESEGDFASFALSFLVALASESVENDDETNKNRLLRCFVVSRIVARACARISHSSTFLEIVDEHVTQMLESLTETTTSGDEEYILAMTLMAFVGAYARHVEMKELPSGVKLCIPQAVYRILRISCEAQHKSPFRPGPLMVRDIILAVPEVMPAVFGKFWTEISVLISSNDGFSAAARLLLLLVTRFPATHISQTIVDSTELQKTLATLRATDKKDIKLERAEAEIALLSKTVS